MRKQSQRPKEIVEYRHLAPVRVPAEDATVEAMHDVIRRIEIMLCRPDCPLTREQIMDIDRLLASRHREWQRADRAESAMASTYSTGVNDGRRSVDFRYEQSLADGIRRMLSCAVDGPYRNELLARLHRQETICAAYNSPSAEALRGRSARAPLPIPPTERGTGIHSAVAPEPDGLLVASPTHESTSDLEKR